MSTEFEALRADVKITMEEIENEENRPRLTFLREFYDSLDSFLMDALESLDNLCGKDSIRPQGKEETVKDGAYQELQRVRRIRSAIHSDSIPIELYYLLEDIKNDLRIDQQIGLDPGSKPGRKFLIEYPKNRFDILRKIVYSNIWGDDAENLQIINMPRTEIQRPLSYSLIAHECFHNKDVLIEQVKDKFHSMDADINEEYMNEMAIDLLSLNYMGPVYAERLIRIPKKIGEHRSNPYPDLDTRLGYSLQYIKWLLEQRDSSPPDLPMQKKIIEDEKKPLFLQLEGEIHSELQNSVSGSSAFQPEEFAALQDHIHRLFLSNDIPTYEEERAEIRKYLGMSNADVHTLSEKMERFLLDSPENREVALPIKPTLLLNLLILVNGYTDKDIRETVLLSFKKWYVTKKTRDQLEREDTD